MKRVILVLVCLVILLTIVGCSKKQIEEYPKPFNMDAYIYKTSKEFYIYMFDVMYNNTEFKDEEYKKVSEPFYTYTLVGTDTKEIQFRTHIMEVDLQMQTWYNATLKKDKNEQEEAVINFQLAEKELIKFLDEY